MEVQNDVEDQGKDKLRDEGKQDYLLEGKTELEIEAMGERSPRFRFAI